MELSSDTLLQDLLKEAQQTNSYLKEISSLIEANQKMLEDLKLELQTVSEHFI